MRTGPGLALAMALRLFDAAPASAEGLPAEPQRGSELDLFKLDATLNATVVTASGVEEEKSIASAAVYTIGRDEIRAHGWRSLSEVLSNVPGLYVIDDLVQPSVGVRGVTGGLNAGTRIIKVMINGTVVNFRPDLTAFLGPEFIPMEAVERIEVAKGPLSALYGANAFLATVNVITIGGGSRSDGSAAARDRTGLSGEVSLRSTVIRSRGGIGGSGLISYRGEHTWVLAALSADYIDRSELTLQETFANPSLTSLYSVESQRDTTGPISAYVQLGASSERLGTLTFQGGVQRLSSAGEFRLNSLLTHTSRISLVNLWTNLRYQKRWSQAGLTADAGYSYGTPDDGYRLNLTHSTLYTFRPNFGYHAVKLAAEGSYAPFQVEERLAIKLGVDLDYALESVLFYTQTFSHPEGAYAAGDSVDLIGPTNPRSYGSYDVGTYLQLSSVPLPRLPGLHLTGNLRVDKIAIGDAGFDPQVSWRVAAAYRFTPRVVFKVFGGRAFQTPSGTLLYSHPGFGFGNNVIGNLNVKDVPELRPQTISSVEAALSAGLGKHLAIEGGVYFQDLDDKIEFRQIGSEFVAANQGRQMSVGFELTPRFTYGRYSVFSWTSVHFNIPTPGVSASDIANPPQLYPTGMAVFGIDIDVPEIYMHVNAQGRVVGPRGTSQSNTFLNSGVSYSLPTYGTADVTVSSTGIHAFGPNTETHLLLSLRNLADTRWSEPGFGGFDVPSIGRTLFLSVKESF